MWRRPQQSCRGGEGGGVRKINLSLVLVAYAQNYLDLELLPGNHNISSVRCPIFNSIYYLKIFVTTMCLLVVLYNLHIVYLINRYKEGVTENNYFFFRLQSPKGRYWRCVRSLPKFLKNRVKCYKNWE